MVEQFTCEQCGQSLPRNRMKELFVWRDRTRERLEVCPRCLDRALAEGRAQGMVGQEKKAAVQVTPGAEAAERGSIG